MLFDQKQNPPRAIIRAAATPVNEEGQSTVPAHPWRRQPDQTTISGPADLREDKREQAALCRGQPWACGADLLADRPRGSDSPGPSGLGAQRFLRTARGRKVEPVKK